ncbi:RCC1/BLIP-II [Pholiota conissans]|uniref:RCC1/BLIP-II n=1 Tax=Pholiota conissans TaxID=109636 RepID=A0A9P6D1M7_9AGAR|nr:RCC1/BLIP-II [Pholiota conissans]
MSRAEAATANSDDANPVQLLQIPPRVLRYELEVYQSQVFCKTLYWSILANYLLERSTDLFIQFTAYSPTVFRIMASTSSLSLLSSGSNAQGQLGNGTLDDSHMFQKCSFLDHPPHTLPSGTSSVVDIAAGANHTLVLLEINGGTRELWGCGDGRKGQLGQAWRQSSLFRRVNLGLNDADLEGYRIKFISATWETSYVVLSCEGHSDIVLSMGSDDFGDLGIGGLNKNRAAEGIHVVRFHHIPEFSEGLDVLGIYSGQRHVILCLNATPSPILVGWGTCRHGQLGDLAVKPSASTPQIISVPSSNIASPSLGIHHTVLLNDSRELICLGSNRKGQLEVAKALTTDEYKIQSIGCTWNGTYVVVQDKAQWTVFSSGSNSHHQLGWKSNEGAVVGQIYFTAALDRRGVPPKIVCGSEHVLILSTPSSGKRAELWGWGWNEHGNLGLGHTEDVPVPIELWTAPKTGDKILDVWAGMGTSWICVEETFQGDLEK